MLPPRESLCPSDLSLEEHLAVPREAVALHAEGCAHCGAWLVAAREAGAHFELELAGPLLARVVDEASSPGGPPDRAPDGIRSGCDSPGRRFPGPFRRAATAVGLVAAAGLAILLVVRVGAGGGGAPAVVARGSGFSVLVQHGGEVRAAPGGERVKVGDAVRFVLAPPGPRHVHVFSVDGAGAISRLVPLDGEAALLVETAGPLPGSAVLGGPGGPERFFAVLARAPLPFAEVERVVSAAVSAHPGPGGLRALEALSLPGVEQASVLLEVER